MTADELTPLVARLTALAEVTRALTEVALSPDDVLETVIRRVAELIGDLSVLMLLSEDGRWLTPAAVHHPDPELVLATRDIFARAPQPAEAGVIGRVVQTGRPQRVSAASLAEMEALILPEHRPHLQRTPTFSLLAVPLRARGRILGALSVSRQTPDRPYTAADEQFLQDLADWAGLAIETARLYAAEAATRAEAELAAARLREINEHLVVASLREQALAETADAARRRSDFLAEASAILASSLDYETRLTSLMRLAVPLLADWCAIDMVRDDHQIHRLAVVHADPAKAEAADELRRRYPVLAPDARHTIVRVLRDGAWWFDATVDEPRFSVEARESGAPRPAAPAGVRLGDGRADAGPRPGDRHADLRLQRERPTAHAGRPGAGRGTGRPGGPGARQRAALSRDQGERGAFPHTRRRDAAARLDGQQRWRGRLLQLARRRIRRRHPRRGRRLDGCPALHPDDVEPTLATWQAAARAGQPYQHAHRLRMANGLFRWHLSRAVPVWGEAGRDARWFGTATDIHDLKQAEAIIERQAELLDLAQEAILAWEIGGTIQLWNRGAEQLYGFTRAEAIGKVSHDLLQTRLPVTRDEFEAALEQAGQWVGELVHARRDGQTVIVESCHQLVRQGDRRVVLETNRDITGRKQAEAERERLLDQITAAEARYHGLFEGAADAILVIDATGRYIEANPAAVALTGYAPDELTAMGVGDLAAGDQAAVAEGWASIRNAGGWQGEAELRRKDGTTVPVETRLTATALRAERVYILGDARHQRAAGGRAHAERVPEPGDARAEEPADGRTLLRATHAAARRLQRARGRGDHQRGTTPGAADR